MSSAMATSRPMRRDSSTAHCIYCHGAVLKLCALSLLREPALVYEVPWACSSECMAAHKR
jgi:hypothetical protein